MNIDQINRTTCSKINTSFPSKQKYLIPSIIAVVGIAAITAGLLSHFHVITNMSVTTKVVLISVGSTLEMGLIARAVYGLFLKSPYSPGATMRFMANHLTNGHFSYQNPDRAEMELLKREGRLGSNHSQNSSSIKVLFLGDIMVSKSGHSPKLDEKMQALLQTADVIIANVESPVVASGEEKRGLSLKFEMSTQYLKSIYSVNEKAQWVFSIANNHTFDNSDQGEEDESGVFTTIRSIREAMPQAKIVGTDIDDGAKSLLTVEKEDGPKIGIVAWTEVMNDENLHTKKRIMREKDLTEDFLSQATSEETLLIGFPHGNEEQSYYPLKETRDRWKRLMGPKRFQVIVGHGPHVVHPAERVGGQGLLFHSIGNFCSPAGRSQTRIGCIPEITVHCGQDRKPTQIDYKVHLLEQGEESVSLLDNIDENSSQYPKIITRLRRIWGNLFSS